MLSLAHVLLWAVLGSGIAGVADSILHAPQAHASGLVTIRALNRSGDEQTPALRAWADEQIADYVATHGPLSSAAGGGAEIGGPARVGGTGGGDTRGNPTPIQFFPIAGNLYQDIWMGAFVDLDPSAGILDFDCLDYTRDGHFGIDAGPRWFAEKRIGIPVFAAQDGVVIVTNDGEDDENTAGSATPGNLVFIDHGGGQVGQYYHLAKNSVAVSVNDVVVAGQPIGLAASSGNSFGPHLHFELHRDDVVYEPFAGACRPGASGWENQPPIERSHYFWDFGFWHDDLNNYPWWPEPFPREGQIAVSDEYMEFWVLGANLPANSTWRVRFFRPNGTQAFDSTEFPYGNSELYQWYLTWWRYYLVDIPGIRTITGTWRMQLEMNGQVMIDAPLEIRTARTPDFNRAPQPIAVALDPPAPAEDQIIACRVQTSRTLDDLDYDVVQYHYVWRVDGAIVRDVTTAAQSDMIPRNAASTCDVVTCDVTPGDGKAEGATVQASAIVGVTCVGDLTGDGVVDLNDLSTLLVHFGEVGASCTDGDLNGDAAVDLSDLSTLLVSFGTSCP